MTAASGPVGVDVSVSNKGVSVQVGKDKDNDKDHDKDNSDQDDGKEKSKDGDKEESEMERHSHNLLNLLVPGAGVKKPGVCGTGVSRWSVSAFSSMLRPRLAMPCVARTPYMR